ncbi:MAG: S26 family signal peptidase, partial [Verrucomicrobiota bacterium]
LVDAEIIKEPEIFRIISSGENGYRGYRLADILTGLTSALTRDTDEIVLAEDEFCVLGDNPETSVDSRHYGAIHRKEIIGKVTRIVWPKDRKRIFGAEENSEPDARD